MRTRRACASMQRSWWRVRWHLLRPLTMRCCAAASLRCSWTSVREDLTCCTSCSDAKIFNCSKEARWGHVSISQKCSDVNTGRFLRDVRKANFVKSNLLLRFMRGRREMAVSNDTRSTSDKLQQMDVHAALCVRARSVLTYK